MATTIFQEKVLLSFIAVNGGEVHFRKALTPEKITTTLMISARLNKMRPANSKELNEKVQTELRNMQDCSLVTEPKEGLKRELTPFGQLMALQLFILKLERHGIAHARRYERTPQ